MSSYVDMFVFSHNVLQFLEEIVTYCLEQLAGSVCFVFLQAWWQMMNIK